MGAPADRYTHGHHESVLRSHRWRTAANSAGFLVEHLSPGHRLLDVGCGPGTITSDLAQLVEPGAAIGVDRSADVVSEASASFVSQTNLTFEVGDVYDLRFDQGTFDVAYAHQVLQHLTDPVAALTELRRVLRREGLLAVRDADYASFAWYPADPRLDRWMALYHEVTRLNGAEADAGRHLAHWVREAGFHDLVVSSSNWTHQSREETQWWGRLWAGRLRESDIAAQCLAEGLASRDELDEFARAFLDWSHDVDSLFVVVSVEVLARA